MEKKFQEKSAELEIWWKKNMSIVFRFSLEQLKCFLSQQNQN